MEMKSCAPRKKITDLHVVLINEPMSFEVASNYEPPGWGRRPDLNRVHSLKAVRPVGLQTWRITDGRFVLQVLIMGFLWRRKCYAGVTYFNGQQETLACDATLQMRSIVSLRRLVN